MSMLEHALQYAGRGWRVFPTHTAKDGVCSCQKGAKCGTPGKHPRIKAWQDHATNDPAQITAWWRKWPSANIAIATGAASGLVVIDLDNLDAVNLWKTLKAPPTLCVLTGRGAHLYYQHPGGEWSNTAGARERKGVDTRGDGGYVIAPPSVHPSGRVYAWRDAAEPALIAELPASVITWLREGAADSRPKREKPAGAAAALEEALRDLPSEDDLLDVAGAIPNADVGWEDFNKIGMAFWAASQGSDAGAFAFDCWSSKSEKHDSEEVAARWQHYFTSPPTDIGFGTLMHMARAAVPGFELRSRQPREVKPEPIPLAAAFAEFAAEQAEKAGGSGSVSGVNKANGTEAPHGLFDDPPLPSGATINDNPLERLNSQFCTIGDLGGKCLVLSWVPSKIDPSVKVPSFQTFRAFTERYSHKYVAVKAKKGEETVTHHKPMGAYWLQWTGRKHYEGMDLLPGAPLELPGNVLNLWRGFGVDPKAGQWPLMKAHITNVLADADAQAATYIFKYAAWCVQNPDKRAEVALVFRGDKGTGKGTFANAVRRIFGAHGMQIYNSKHLTGQFNGHLRSCLLLFADEAFWVGDKAGESTLKGMITERTLVVEHKGVDAQAWHNRLKVIMAANADWVVPASHNERRYAVFNVNSSRVGDRAYFNALNLELENGGLEAMLHDLLAVKLEAWHPREVVTTKGLQEQKARSLSPLQMWWENALQMVTLPVDQDLKATSATLLEGAQKWEDRWVKINPTSLGLFLKTVGCVKGHHREGNFWTVPEVKIAREIWERRYGKWAWNDADAEKWNEKDKNPSTYSPTGHSQAFEVIKFVNR